MKQKKLNPMHFEFKLKDISKRKNNLIDILNNMNEFGYPIVKVLNLRQINEFLILSRIRISVTDDKEEVADMKVAFDIFVQSELELKVLASSFNMVSAHCSNIQFELVDEETLTATMYPKTIDSQEAIESFIETFILRK